MKHLLPLLIVGIISGSPIRAEESASGKTLAAEIETTIPASSPDRWLLIDDFEPGIPINSLGYRCWAFEKAPSTIVISYAPQMIQKQLSNVISLTFKKHNNLNGVAGGWCGYYTRLRDLQSNAYLDASSYGHLVFWLKGKTGRENFVVGLADQQWETRDDLAKSQPVTAYLPKGKITDQWQQVRIPLAVFGIDLSKLASVGIAFDSSCLPKGAGAGVVYLDDVALE